MSGTSCPAQLAEWRPDPAVPSPEHMEERGEALEPASERAGWRSLARIGTVKEGSKSEKRSLGSARSEPAGKNLRKMVKKGVGHKLPGSAGGVATRSSSTGWDSRQPKSSKGVKVQNRPLGSARSEPAVPSPEFIYILAGRSARAG